MSVFGIGLSYGLATLFAMFSGMPIAFALGAVAVVFMAIYMPAASLDTVTQNVYEEMASITLLSIPLFILKGAAIGRSRAGQDLYSALHAWLHRVPGGLGVANVFACALFAAMAGSSPATCSAIGSAGIPEMRKRGYSGGFAAGIIAAGGTLGILLPPSITMILFAIAAEKSLGRLFLAGIGPGLLLVSLFGAYAVIRFRREYAAAAIAYAKSGTPSAILNRDEFTLAERFSVLPRVIPFVLLLTGVMIALYGGYATPSETAGLGGLLALALIALIYSVWRPTDLAPILTATIRESTMLMMIIGMSLLYSYVMSYLHISQSAAEAIVAMHLPRWELLFAILVMVVVLGFFLPPVSIILMTAPIILPPLRAANFDIIWFGVVMTIVMEMGLIHPPVGLNIFVIRNVAPDIPLERSDLGHAALRAVDDGGRAGAVLRAGDLHLAAQSGDGAGRGKVSYDEGWAKRPVRRSSESEGGSVPTICIAVCPVQGARAPLPTHKFLSIRRSSFRIQRRRHAADRRMAKQAAHLVGGGEQLRHVDAGRNPHALQHVDHVLGRDIAGGAGRVAGSRRARRPRNRSRERPPPSRHRDWPAPGRRCRGNASRDWPIGTWLGDRAQHLLGLQRRADADGVAERDLVAAEVPQLSSRRLRPPAA